MKRFHPSGHLVDNNKNFAGMIVHNTDGKGFKAPKDTLALIMAPEVFFTAVSRDKIQMFVCKNNEILVDYTDEELKAMKKHPEAAVGINEYFKSDVRFTTYPGITEQTLMVSAVQGLKMLNLYMVNCVIFRTTAFSDGELKQIKKTTNTTPQRIADNMYVITSELATLINFLKTYHSQYGVSINVDTMTNPESLTNKIKPNRLVNLCSMYELDTIGSKLMNLSW